MRSSSSPARSSRQPPVGRFREENRGLVVSRTAVSVPASATATAPATTLSAITELAGVASSLLPPSSTSMPSGPLSAPVGPSPGRGGKPARPRARPPVAPSAGLPAGSVLEDAAPRNAPPPAPVVVLAAAALARRRLDPALDGQMHHAPRFRFCKSGMQPHFRKSWGSKSGMVHPAKSCPPARRCCGRRGTRVPLAATGCFGRPYLRGAPLCWRGAAGFESALGCFLELP
jgi:hypothetical protein